MGGANHTFEFDWRTLVSLGGLVLLAIYWLKHSEDSPRRLIAKWLATAAIGAAIYFIAFRALIIAPLLIAPLGIALSVIWTPNLGQWLARPLTSIFDGGREPDQNPSYAFARDLRCQARYAEAIAEIHLQLAKRPNDYEGLLFLAEIHAAHCRDFSAAHQVVDRLVASTPSPARQARALLLLAHWYCKHDRNPHSARRLLQRIIATYPRTESASVAQQNLHRLDAHLRKVNRR
ncbi:MAG: hypothetical protein AB1705_20830 [Verrucomicrobiota bacterium]